MGACQLPRTLVRRRLPSLVGMPRRGRFLTILQRLTNQTPTNTNCRIPQAATSWVRRQLPLSITGNDTVAGQRSRESIL